MTLPELSHTERFRFVSDDDGHDYLIPAGSEKDFLRWLDGSPYWDDYEGTDFDDYRVDGINFFSFIDPKRDRR